MTITEEELKIPLKEIWGAGIDYGAADEERDEDKARHDRDKAESAILAAFAELRAERDALRAAVEAVEWIPVAGTAYCVCPWCGNTFSIGHAPDCQRQRALGSASAELQVKHD